jgi:flagellar biosynthesis protein FlhG
LRSAEFLMAKREKNYHKRIIAIGGGKGGIGKSVIASNLAFAFVRNGKKVVIVNLDLGSDNASTILGIKPSSLNISSFINGKAKNINDIVLKTSYCNLGIIQGSSGYFKIANLKYIHKQKIIKNLRNIDADYIILDLGAGFSLNTLDFFNSSDEKILIFTPEPTSIKDAYSFIKCAVYRKLTKTFCKNNEISFLIESKAPLNDDGVAKKMIDFLSDLYEFDKDLSNIAMNVLSQFRPKLILNMAADKKELAYADKIMEVSKKFLNVETEFLGIINNDESVKTSVKRMKPLAVLFPVSDASKKINILCKKLIDAERKDKSGYSKVKEINVLEKYLFNMNARNYYEIVKKSPIYNSTITEVQCNECSEEHFYLPFQYNSGLISCKSCGYHLNLKEIFYSLNNRNKSILINNASTRRILETNYFDIS